MKWAWAPALLLATAAAAQEAKDVPRYRAVTLDPKERRVMPVPGLERTTSSSGACIEEELTEFQSLTLVATCAGVRTSLAWLKDGSRMHVMACAEDEGREPDLVKARKKVQADLKALPGVTACVRWKRIEVLGWVLTAAEKAKVAAVAKKHGADDKVEKVGDGG